VDSRLGQVNTVSPKVSIVVTNYNYSEYIDDCLQSVSRQTYPDLECIIVDDHSSDESAEKIQQFIHNDRSHVAFKLIRHESTRGQYAAFRTGIAHATGPFISFLDADDLLLPDFVAEHVRVHVSCPPVAFTSSNQYQIDSQGQLIGGSHPDLHTITTYRTVGTVSLRRSFWVWATTSSMMFRRTVLDFVLADADDAFKKCADNYVCHFADLLGGSILIPTVLGCYRRHQRNTFSNNPLIGGRLPTGDMGHHPTHDLVLHHIRSRLFERHQQFIALLGLDGLLHILAKVTPLAQLWSTFCAIRRITAGGFRDSNRFYVIYGWLNLRTLVRALRGRRSSYTMHDIEGAKRGANVASYTDYQRHRRDAK
jgi:glycosyltransferase involved in cell wall biosynthesis